MADYKEYWRKDDTYEGAVYHKQYIKVEAYARGEVLVKSVEKSLAGERWVEDTCFICFDSVEDVDAVIAMLTEARAVMVGAG